jgi:hypothetical protein
VGLGLGLKGGFNFSFSFTGAGFGGGLGLRVLDFCRGTCTGQERITLLSIKSFFILAASTKTGILGRSLAFRLLLFAFGFCWMRSFPVWRFGTPVTGSIPINTSSGTVLLLAN